jgi:hypothetical protein
MDMRREDFKQMRALGERKVEDESNLRDLSEVRVQQFEQGSARYEVDEKNGRYREIDRASCDLGCWQELER